jgi:apolipoprotein N-acyltransferase
MPKGQIGRASKAPASEASARKAGSWKCWLAAALSAGLLELPFPIAGPMPPWRSIFAWFGLVPLLWALLSHPNGKGAVWMGHPGAVGKPDPVGERDSESRPLRRAFLLAYFCGVLWYTGNCYWIYDTMLIHGGLPPVVSFLILLLFSLVLGAYFGLFGLGLALVHRATGSVRWALVFAPFLWTALELAAARITSVPWDQLGYSQVDSILSSYFAPWTGVYGISFLLVYVSAQLAKQFILPPSSLRQFWLRVLWFAPPFLVFALSSITPPSATSPTSATAVLIQPNLDVENTGSWNAPAEWSQHIADFIQLGSESCTAYFAGIPGNDSEYVEGTCAKKSPPDLIVWPESPAPFFEADSRFQQAMAEVARTDHAPIIVNGVGSDLSAAGSAPDQDVSGQDSIDHVSAMVFNAQGSEVGRFDKIHLVPWGEYVPYPQIFFFAKKLTGRVAHFTPGTVRSVFRLQTADGQTHKYGIFICYESVFADEVRLFAKSSAEVFVNVSDDGWYGDTSAPWQHLNMARMRAIENRRWILRATNDGVTAAIDPYGRVRQSIARHAVDALAAQYGFRSDITFYTAHGDVFAWMCAVLALGVVGWAAIRPRKP